MRLTEQHALQYLPQKQLLLRVIVKIEHRWQMKKHYLQNWLLHWLGLEPLLMLEMLQLLLFGLFVMLVLPLALQLLIYRKLELLRLILVALLVTLYLLQLERLGLVVVPDQRLVWQHPHPLLLARFQL